MHGVASAPDRRATHAVLHAIKCWCVEVEDSEDIEDIEDVSASNTNHAEIYRYPVHAERPTVKVTFDAEDPGNYMVVLLFSALTLREVEQCRRCSNASPEEYMSNVRQRSC